MPEKISRATDWPFSFTQITGPIIFKPIDEFSPGGTTTVAGGDQPVEPGETPEERPPATTFEIAESGCIKCADPDNPTILGDLRDRQKQNSPLVRPPCDNQLKGRIVVIFNWKNALGKKFTGDAYVPQLGDASVFATIEQFDELINLITFAVGAVTTLPQTLTVAGIKSVDNTLRELFRRLTEIFDGKADVDLILAKASFTFETPALRTSVGIRHAEEFEYFCRDRGTCSMAVMASLDSEPRPALTHEFSFRTEADGENSELAFGPADPGPKRDSVIVFQGSHTLTLRFELKAGHAGIGDDALRANLLAAIQSAQSAASAVLAAATSAVNALSQGMPIPDDVGDQLKNAAGSALDAALNSLGAVLRALANLRLESKGLVKLYSSRIELICLEHTTKS